MTNAEIVEQNYGLISECCRYQTIKFRCPPELYDDILQEVCYILLRYDNGKLNKINDGSSLNSFVTGILVHQLYSYNSMFYRKFRKFGDITEDIEDHYEIEDV